MDIPYRAATYLVAFLLPVSATASSDEDEAWSRQYKQTLVQACHRQSLEQTTELYRRAFNGRMDSRSFEAFLVANSAQLARSCQCLFQRIAGEFSPSDFESQTTQVSVLSEALLSEGGACATDVERVIDEALARLDTAEGAHAKR